MQAPKEYQTPPLAPFACQRSERGRCYAEPPPAHRDDFQRDRDRIIHSQAFRKLRNKTQVFVEWEGDFHRTRLTHSLEVAQIARTMARLLALNEDLTETIALAHDLGHTCFGHAGEAGLDEVMGLVGGFDHNIQTFRILTELENSYPDFGGLNLTWETLEGIIKHNGPLHAPWPAALARFNQNFDLSLNGWPSLEAQLAALADDIAYNTHDVADGVAAGLLEFTEIITWPIFSNIYASSLVTSPNLAPKLRLKLLVRQAIGALVADVLDETRRRLRVLAPTHVQDIRNAGQTMVAFSESMQKDINDLRDLLKQKLYRAPPIMQMWSNAVLVVQGLFEHFMVQPVDLPEDWRQQCAAAPSSQAVQRLIGDYIAGMTDRFAIREYRRLIDPHFTF